MTECNMCETNKRSRLVTFTYPEGLGLSTKVSTKVCKSCHRWLTSKFYSKKQWKED